MTQPAPAWGTLCLSPSIGESSNKVQKVLCVGGETGVCFHTRWPEQYFFYQG